MSADPSMRREPEVSGWAVAGVTFAGCILALIGVFQIIAGLTAIFNDEFFVVTNNYTFDIDTTVWGWLHLLLGILLVVTAFGLFFAQHLGRRDRDLPGDAQRGGQLLLHPVLPAVVDRPDRARRVGDLGAHAARRDRHPIARGRGPRTTAWRGR